MHKNTRSIMPSSLTAEMVREGLVYVHATPAPQDDEKRIGAWLEGLYATFMTAKPEADIRPDLVRAMTWHFDRTEQEVEKTIHLPQMCELVLDAAEGRIGAASTPT